MERLGTARRYQSSLPDDPFDELYREYHETTESSRSEDYPRPSTKSQSTPPKGPGSLAQELAALDGSIDLLAQRVWELTQELRTKREWEDGDEE